ncbi:L-lactate dehydrogenase [Desulfoferrobacter suflitae]|uniref:L-lactate dehydrogenase n=1 Tax=Desulfoferrobacter suflitae TaxID=2865782 RepID=UPI002164B9A0|nr:L-lactate dehydrogenase [Desulfoferrobacter suflitae]MCK8601450.1 L-lactate dehydrogenase [Desulfoferrobacter suflitae]
MKVGVVGAGFVGATCAYAMVIRGIGREIVLVDKNASRAQAEADDIFHAVPFTHALRVRSGDYPDLAGSRVVIVAAGVAQKPAESRLQLLQRNAAVFQEVIPNILTHAPHAILLVVTNPVDIMTHLAARYAVENGAAPGHVLGSGTTLDTARFRALLGDHLGVDPSHVHAYVVGEHGDSEVLAWSSVQIGGLPMEQYCLANKDYCSRLPRFLSNAQLRREIDDKVRQAAYHIIQGKGATYYGIGGAVSHIVKVILRDQRSLLTVSAPMAEVEGVADVTLSLPHLIGGTGVLSNFMPALNDEERAALKKSARIIRDALDQLDSHR